MSRKGPFVPDYQHFFDMAQDLLCISSPEGQLKYVNPAWERTLGYTAAELTACPFIDFVFPEDKERTMREYKKLKPGMSDVNFENRYVSKNGSVKCFAWTAAGSPSDGLIYAIARDVTELKGLERRIREQAKFSALGDMASGVAHEVNNPLSVVQLKTVLLREAAETGRITPEDLVKGFKTIEKHVTRIATVVRALRSFSGDGGKVAPQTLSVAELFEDTLSICIDRFRKANVSLEIPKIREDLYIKARRGQVVQALYHVLSNALEAVVDLPEKWVRVVVSETSKRLEVSVIDSGSGIQAELREKIMQPFFTTKETGVGRGLGLSVARGILEAHGGTLRLSTQSPNTCFLLTLIKHEVDQATL